MTFGVTPEGFVKKRLADIKTEIENEVRAVFGNQINLTPQSVFSQFIGILADRESALWELAEDTYNSQYPDTAEGIALDNIASISGIIRLAAQQSRVRNVILRGDVGTLVPPGTVFSVSGSPTSRFSTLTGVTLAAGADEVQTISFSGVPASGSFRLTHLGFSTELILLSDTLAQIKEKLEALPYIREVTVTGSFATTLVVSFVGQDGKIDQPLLGFSDNTLQTIAPAAVIITITETTPGVPQGLVEVLAEAFGPIDAPIYSLTEIETPVTGLDSVLNTEETILGRNLETDAELKVRRLQSLQRAGASTVEAIRARLLEVQDVQEVVIFENVTNVTDVNGLPPKSFRAFVQGGDTQEVGDNIWLNKPAGIQTTGDIEVSVNDSQGVVQTIFFSRPIEVPIFIDIQITRDTTPTSPWPANGADLVRAALVDYIEGLSIGEDVIVYPRLVASLNDIPGILDVELGVGIAADPPIGQDDNIVIAINQVATVSDPANDIDVVILP